MLLQEIYAREAMKEAGITGSLEIVHDETPKTIVNGKDYELLFPKHRTYYLYSHLIKVIDTI